jgi:hypothetical protein
VPAFLLRRSDRGVKLRNHSIVPKLRMRGTIPLLPHTPASHDAWWSAKDNYTFYTLLRVVKLFLKSENN